jgi:hypothetical protein
MLKLMQLTAGNGNECKAHLRRWYPVKDSGLGPKDIVCRARLYLQNLKASVWSS